MWRLACILRLHHFMAAWRTPSDTFFQTHAHAAEPPRNPGYLGFPAAKRSYHQPRYRHGSTGHESTFGIRAPPRHGQFDMLLTRDKRIKKSRDYSVITLWSVATADCSSDWEPSCSGPGASVKASAARSGNTFDTLDKKYSPYKNL